MRKKSLFSLLICFMLAFTLLPMPAFADSAGTANVTVAAVINSVTAGPPEAVNFTVTVKNYGPDDATNVIVSLQFPLESTEQTITATPPQGTLINDGTHPGGTVTTWDAGTIASGSTVVMNGIIVIPTVTGWTAGLFPSNVAIISSVDQSADDFTFSITDGDITINDAGSGKLSVTYGASQETTAPFPNTQSISISGSTTLNSVLIDSGAAANVTLDNVDIDVSAIPLANAFALTDSTATLTITGSNSLKSGSDCAGLHCPSGAALTIDGSGSLIAESYSGAAGIGGNADESAGTVKITSGTVTANGGFSESAAGGGAGIGGGNDDGSGGTVTIIGGTVTAVGGAGGIGPGGAALGGGGGSLGGDGGALYISGGSVKIANVGGVGAGTPAQAYSESGPGGVQVYRSTLMLGTSNASISAGSLVLSGTASGYGTSDIKTDNTSTLYFYLPTGNASATYNGSLYTATIAANDSNSFALSHTISYTLSNLTSDNSASYIADGEALSFTLTPNADCILPDSIAITMGGAPLTEGTGYTYNPATGEVSVAAVSGDVLIIADGVTNAPVSSGSSHTIYYNVSAEQRKGGTIKLSTMRVKSGNSSLITVTPDAGYEIKDVLINGDSVGAVASYTVENIKADVKVTVVFRSLRSFTDVTSDDWYYNAVMFIDEKGITNGTGNGSTFSPNARLTRGEFIVMLMKAYGLSPDENPIDNFTDAGNNYYTGYLAAAKHLGISAGVGNNMYAPTAQITRQEMFTLLYNALKAIDQLPSGHFDSSMTSLADFADSGDIAAWARDATALFVETGTVQGSGDRLNLTSTTTRAEMAQLLYNLLGK